MAHFYGTVQGAGGMASRLGGANTGLRTRAASWQGAITVELSIRNGVDWAHVAMDTHGGAGRNRVLYSGPINADGKPASVRSELPVITKEFLDKA